MTPDEAKKAEVKTLCEKSLKALCQGFLGYTLWDTVHDDVEVMLRKSSQRKAILLPRDHSKSTFVTIAWSIQQVLKNPNIRILIANGVWDNSRKFLMEIKAQLEHSNLKHFYGNFVSNRWNSDDIIVAQRSVAHKEPTISTTGVEAESVGMRADIIIADDLMGEQNFKTPEQREKVKRFRRSLVNILEPGGVMVDIMTRWHLDDTFTEIEENEKDYYDTMVRQVVENGKLIYPKKFSKRFDPISKAFIPAPDENCLDYVDYLKRTKPLDEFMSQFMNDPISSENQVFKQEMFKYWKERPQGLYLGMAADLAISQRNEADYTAISVIGMDKDWNLYLLDYLRGHWGPQQIIDNIFQMQSRWKPHAVGIEVNGFQRTLKEAVEMEQRTRKQYFGVAEIRNGPEKSKENRIKSLEPFYRQGKVFHAAWMKGKDVETELLTFPKGRHDDIIDSMAMVLPLLSPGIGFQSSHETPEYSYDWWMKQVQQRSQNLRGFYRGV